MVGTAGLGGRTRTLAAVAAACLLICSSVLGPAVAWRPIAVAGPFQWPSSIAFMPDGAILVSERVGRLQLIRPQSNPTEISGLPPVFSKDQAGLLDIAVDPRFSENRTVYFSYVHGTDKSSTVRVAKAKFDDTGNRLRNHRVIFESTPGTGAEQVGGRVAVTADGHVFLTLGDRWQRDRAQALSDLAGSIVRFRTDGTVPKDNPFAALRGARPEIWTYGHRNPQGLAFDAQGRLWSHEHGPKGGDELNLIVAGRNYGWPVITYGRRSDRPRNREGRDGAAGSSLDAGNCTIGAGGRACRWKDDLLDQHARRPVTDPARVGIRWSHQ
jgi:glucose/arabinose dehydrogenase